MCFVLCSVHAHAPFLCVVCFAVCDMSEPSPEYGPDFWVKACGGKYLVTSKIGVHWTLAELIYDKYCRPNVDITREHLYYILAWLKQAPTYRFIQSICPSNVSPHCKCGKGASGCHYGLQAVRSASEKGRGACVGSRDGMWLPFRC